jgi:hypothetical protein
VANSITEELFGQLGVQLPDSVRRALEQEVERRLLASYSSKVARLQPKIKDLGRKAGEKIIDGIVASMVITKDDIEGAAKNQMSAVESRLILPILTPFLEGLKETAAPRATRLASGFAIALISVGAGAGYFLGSRK